MLHVLKYFYFYFFCVLLEIESRVLGMPGKCSISGL